MNLEVRPNPSKSQWLLTCCAGLAASWGVTQSQLDGFLAPVLILAIWLSVIQHSLWIAGQTRNSIAAVSVSESGWQIFLAGGEVLKAEVRSPVLVLPQFVVAHFEAGGRRFCWVVCWDSVDSTTLRRLRVALLNEPLPAPLTVARWYQDRIVRLRRD